MIKKVIVVDDEIHSIIAFERISRNISEIEIVGSFQSAEEAVEFAESNFIDMAFIDVLLGGGITGFQLAAMLRIIRPNLAIVFVSADDGYSRDYDGLGAVDFITKPIKCQYIERAIQRVK